MKLELKEWILAASCLVAIPAPADVFKCIDASGRTIYQDTDCNANQRTVHVDTRFANTLPLGFSREDANLIETLANETATINATRISERDKHLTAQRDRLAAKKEACQRAKAAMTDHLAEQRRNGRQKPSGHRRLLKTMHDACSA